MNIPRAPDGEVWKTTRRIIESQVFDRGVCYEFRDDHVIVWTRDDGMLAVHRRRVRAFADELMQIAETYEGVRT